MADRKLTNDKTLTPLMLAALNVVGKRLDKARDLLEVGEGQKVDVTLRVHGDIGVGGASVYTSTEAPKAADVLAIVIGAISAPAQRKAVEAVKEFFASFIAGGEQPAVPHEHLVRATSLLASASRQVLNNRRGSVSGNLSVDIL